MLPSFLFVHWCWYNFKTALFFKILPFWARLAPYLRIPLLLGFLGTSQRVGALADERLQVPISLIWNFGSRRIKQLKTEVWINSYYYSCRVFVTSQHVTSLALKLLCCWGSPWSSCFWAWAMAINHLSPGSAQGLALGKARHDS